MPRLSQRQPAGLFSFDRIPVFLRDDANAYNRDRVLRVGGGQNSSTNRFLRGLSACTHRVYRGVAPKKETQMRSLTHSRSASSRIRG